MPTRRAILKKAAKAATVLGVSSTALVALTEIAEAGCGWKWTYVTSCKYGTLYRVYRWCCSTPDGGQACGNITNLVPVGTC